jgi:hypothetical protein
MSASAWAWAWAEEEEEKEEEEGAAGSRLALLAGLERPSPALPCVDANDSVLIELARDGVDPRELSVS